MNRRLVVWFLIVCLGGLHAFSARAEPEKLPEATESTESIQALPGILLADTAVVPGVSIAWIAGGEPQSSIGNRPYGPPIGGEKIDGNLRCYVALGGTRIETGAGHPKGILIRVGLTKIDNTKPLFEDIEPGSNIVLRVHDVRMNQEVKYHQGTGLVHLKYSLGDLEACSLPGTARNQFLMTDPEDTLGGRVTEGVNATPGGLDGSEGHGDLEVTVDEGGLVGMEVRIPYAMLRHLQDPWESDLPNTFFEPVHLHAEAELIPVDVEPFDRDPMPPMNDPNDPGD